MNANAGPYEPYPADWSLPCGCIYRPGIATAVWDCDEHAQPEQCPLLVGEVCRRHTQEHIVQLAAKGSYDESAPASTSSTETP